MKRFFGVILAMLIVFPTVSAERKKVGLVLGGGGAKGMAHIGVLQVLEEAGIPIDYITGTSMGAIVGGLYAIGYSPAEIDSMVALQDWMALLSDRVERTSQSFPEKENSERYVVSLPFGMEKKDRLPDGVIRGLNLQNLFSNLTIGYHDSVDFNSLAVPFACVAVDVVAGKEKVFHHGSLPVAMRASMAIPAVFTPIRLDSMVLLDGGLLNNYPADVALRMGADILIGVDLGTSDLKDLDKLNNTSDVIGQIIALLGHDKYSVNKDTTDLLIRPNVSPYTAASFSTAAIDTLIRRGEQAARLQWNDLIALKEKIGMAPDERPVANRNPHPVGMNEAFPIRKINFEGADPRDMKWLLSITGLKANSMITADQLQSAMSIVIGTDAYSQVSYKLTGEEQQDLVLAVQEKPISSLNAGIRFDSEELVAVQLNATLNYRSRYRSKLAFTGRIGERTSARLDYSIGPNLLRNMGLSYMFTYHDLNVYYRGHKWVNTTYRRQLVELAYSDMNWLSFRLKLGGRFEYYDYNDFLYAEDVPIDPDGPQIYNKKGEHFFNYFAEAQFETMDRRYFPRKGVSLSANYTVYTDNFVSYKGHTPFAALALDFTAVLPLNSHLSLLPAFSGRVITGHDVAYPYMNAMGGEMPGKYLPQQLPFAGINHVELADHTLLVASLHLRQRIAGKHYVSLIGNYGMQEDDFFSILNGRHLWGGRLGYAFDSVAGPLDVNLGMSNRVNSVQFYLNLGFSF